ncbi:MAG: DNA polymerase/3'-5' exonuclease PolX [Casimicrobiaceae bacterium]
MAAMDRTGVARSLEQIAAYLEFNGENPFRVRAFTAAAKSILWFTPDLDAAIADGSLAQVKGVGPAILQIVTELVRTGRSELLEQLREDVPAGLVDMLAIPGLGVAKIKQVQESLGVETVPELEAAARDGRLAALPRFGERTAEKILKGIAFLRQASQWRLAHHAAREAEAFREAFARLPHILSAHTAGEVRRRNEVVRDLITVLVADVSPEEVFRHLSAMPGVNEIAGEDERRVTLRFAGGASVQVVVTPPQNFGAVMVQATGSADYLAALASAATARGFNLAGAALWHGSRFVPTPTEEALFAALAMPWLPPELREADAELDGPVPRLVEMRDLRGFLHCHTSASDGSNSVRQIAGACRAAGYQYVGITDHSRAAAYAGGMSTDDIQRQWDEIDAVNLTLGDFKVLKGIESDILVDGALDYPADILAGFDFIIGSIHSRFNLSRAEMTERVCRAMTSPYLTILGHPTGRLLLSREAYALDLDAVFRAAAEHHVAIEINADPHRLDLDWRVLGDARRAGVMISIGADAHNLAGLGNVEFGVGIARKGGLGPDAVLNCRDADGLLDFARARRLAGLG